MLAGVFLMVLSAGAVELIGTAAIIDGDTLKIQGSTIRLFGIDAAETGQQCINAEKRTFRPSDGAIARVESMTKGVVRCRARNMMTMGALLPSALPKLASKLTGPS